MISFYTLPAVLGEQVRRKCIPIFTERKGRRKKRNSKPFDVFHVYVQKGESFEIMLFRVCEFRYMGIHARRH